MVSLACREAKTFVKGVEDFLYDMEIIIILFFLLILYQSFNHTIIFDLSTDFSILCIKKYLLIRPKTLDIQNYIFG